MKKFVKVLKDIVVKHGSAIAAFAVVIAAISANSSCLMPFNEPAEPKNIGKLKKFA